MIGGAASFDWERSSNEEQHPVPTSAEIGLLFERLSNQRPSPRFRIGLFKVGRAAISTKFKWRIACSAW